MYLYVLLYLMSVVHLEDRDEYDAVLEKHKDDNVVLFFKFGASWCVPCKRIEPHYEAFSLRLNPGNEHTNDVNYLSAEFYHLDIDEESLMELMSEDLNLKLVPHFFVVRNKEVLETLQTSQKDVLTVFIQKHLRRGHP